MRNEIWLENRFDYIFKKYFFDLEATNEIIIKFSRKSRRQLGAIKQMRSRLVGKNNPTTIVINGFFRDEFIPEFVVDAVIAHELSHYAHGFNSPLPQLHRHPHRGGVIKKELAERGIADLEKRQKKWMKENWEKYIKSQITRSKSQTN